MVILSQKINTYYTRNNNLYILNQKTYIMKKLNFIILLLAYLAININSAYSQYIYSSVKERSLGSDYIVEATIIEQFTFESNGNIYTANELEVCSIIYNKLESKPSNNSNNKLFVLTHGGALNNIIQDRSHSPKLTIGDEGVFFLNRTFTDVPNYDSVDSSFYHLNSGNQGLVMLDCDAKYDLSVYDALTNYNHIDEVLDSVFYYLNITPYTSSCILEKKSGLVLHLDDIEMKSDTIFSSVKIQGKYSKSYDLEKTYIILDLGGNIDVDQYNFFIQPKSSIIKTNYNVDWSQPTNNQLLIKVERKPNSASKFQANKQIKEYIEFGINKSALNFNLNQISVSNARFWDSKQNLIDFKEIHLEVEDGLFKMKPVIDYFSPELVAAGLTQDNAEGSNYKGYVEIHGQNFGDIPKDSLVHQIPWNYSVRFVRDNQNNGGNVNESLKITPHSSDYEFWTDTLIKVRVPTYGYFVSGDDIIPKSAQMAGKTAMTGNIHVQRGLLFDDVAKVGNKSTLRVAFAMKTYPNSTLQEILEIHKLPNKHSAPNGAYQFIIDSSFTNNINLGGDASDFVEQLKDAFCEWNQHSDLKVEIVDTCSSTDTDFPCGVIKCVPHDNNSNSTVYATTEIGQPSQNCYPNLHVRNIEMKFRYGVRNGKIPFYWSLNPQPKNVIDSSYFYDTALHEVGHVLQHGHVREDTSIMRYHKHIDRMFDEPAKDGAKHFKFLSLNGACPISSGHLLSCGTTAVNEIENDKLLIYPTITYENCHIVAPKPVRSIHIFNQVGQIVRQIEELNRKEFELSLNSLNSGVYFIRCNFDKTFVINKIIKI